MTEKYDNGTCAKWYYNTSNNITDGENEYTVHRKEPVTYLDGEILHGTNDLLDRLNEYECEVEQLKSRVIQLEINVEKELEINDSLHDIVSEYGKENNQLKEQLIDCEQKKQAHKEMLMNSTAVVEQKKLQKIIYGIVIAKIDEKIKEVVVDYKYGDVHPDIAKFAHDRLFELRKEFEYD